MSKKVISDNGGHVTIMDLSPLDLPSHPGWYKFMISTTYADSKNPDDEQVKYTACLDTESLKKLKELFNEH